MLGEDALVGAHSVQIRNIFDCTLEEGDASIVIKAFGRGGVEFIQEAELFFE